MKRGRKCAAAHGHGSLGSWRRVRNKRKYRLADICCTCLAEAYACSCHACGVAASTHGVLLDALMHVSCQRRASPEAPVRHNVAACAPWFAVARTHAMCRRSACNVSSFHVRCASGARATPKRRANGNRATSKQHLSGARAARERRQIGTSINAKR